MLGMVLTGHDWLYGFTPMFSCVRTNTCGASSGHSSSTSCNWRWRRGVFATQHSGGSSTLSSGRSAGRPCGHRILWVAEEKRANKTRNKQVNARKN